MSDQLAGGEPLDLEAIEARSNAATAAPWEAVCDSTRPDIYTKSRDGGYMDEGHLLSMSKYENCDDAEFIAKARTDIPALIAEIRRLRAEQPQNAGGTDDERP